MLKWSPSLSMGTTVSKVRTTITATRIVTTSCTGQRRLFRGGWGSSGRFLPEPRITIGWRDDVMGSLRTGSTVVWRLGSARVTLGDVVDSTSGDGGVTGSDKGRVTTGGFCKAVG